MLVTSKLCSSPPLEKQLLMRTLLPHPLLCIWEGSNACTTPNCHTLGDAQECAAGDAPPPTCGAVAMSLQSLGSSEPGWDQDIPKEWSFAPRHCLVLSILSSSSLQLRCPQLTMGTPTVLRLQSHFGRTWFTTWHGPRLMGTQKKCKKMDMRWMRSA